MEICNSQRALRGALKAAAMMQHAAFEARQVAELCAGNHGDLSGRLHRAADVMEHHAVGMLQSVIKQLLTFGERAQ